MLAMFVVSQDDVSGKLEYRDEDVSFSLSCDSEAIRVQVNCLL